MRICASLTASTTAQVIEAMDRLAGTCDLFEVRADLIGDLDHGAILRARSRPLLFTCLTRVEGGTWPDDDPRRRVALLEAIRDGFDYVDVNLRSGLVDVMREKSGRGLVVSHHELDGVPADLDGLYRSVADHGADIVKIAVRPRSVAELGRFLGFARRVAASAGPRMIPVAMGPLGVCSRILGGRLDAPFTFASTAAGAESAPGQVPALLMRRRYRAHEIGMASRVWGVVGQGVSDHPALAVHNAAFRSHNLDAVCVPVEAESLPDLFEGLAGLDLAGMAIERPFRCSMVNRLDAVDDAARESGCVGTVVARNGRLEGFETDGEAVAGMLAARARLSECRAVVLGVGAAARAVAAAMRRRGATATLVARSASRGADAARRDGYDVVLDERLDGSLAWNVLINATPAGNETMSAVPEAALHTGALVVDMVPSTRPTRLIAEASARGCSTLDGNAVLLARCGLQFQRWTRLDPPLDAMRQALEQSAEGLA